MTTTDPTQFPEEVRARLEDLDRRIEGAQTEEQDHQRALGRLQADLAQSLLLRAAIVETAEAFVSGPWMPIDNPDPIEPSIEDDAPSRRQRRDIRGEVLACLQASDVIGMTATQIAARIGAPQSSVEKALAVHERNGKLVEKPEGVWSAAPGPVLTPVLGHTQNGPILGVPYVEASPPVPNNASGQGQTKPAPSADHVLDFITRGGDMGVSTGQLERIGCTESILAILRHTGTAEEGNDGRWRTVAEVTEMVEDEA